MPDGIALLSLGDLDDPEALHPNLERFGDAYRMSLFVPIEAMAADPINVLRFLRAQLGPLLDRHPDGRGVFVFPEGAWKAAAYEALVAEVGSAGFWASASPPPAPEEPRRSSERAEEALSGVLRAGRSPAKAPSSDLQKAAARHEAVAAELEQAAKHLRRAAENFRNQDVPRAAAHRVAADGHLVRSRAELDALAVLHAEKSKA